MPYTRSENSRECTLNRVHIYWAGGEHFTISLFHYLAVNEMQSTCYCLSFRMKIGPKFISWFLHLSYSISISGITSLYAFDSLCLTSTEIRSVSAELHFRAFHGPKDRTTNFIMCVLKCRLCRCRVHQALDHKLQRCGCNRLSNALRKCIQYRKQRMD